MGSAEVKAFLTHLAVKENVAASTQNQTLSALLFLYREVLKKDLGPIGALHAKKPKQLPTLATPFSLINSFSSTLPMDRSLC